MAVYDPVPPCSKCSKPATISILLKSDPYQLYTCPEHHQYFVIVYSPWLGSEIIEAA